MTRKSSKTKTAGFPKTLYVKMEEDGDQQFPLAGETPGDLVAETSESFKVGIYQLVKVGELTTSVTVAVES